MQSLHAEANEPPLYLIFDKLCIQCCEKVSIPNQEIVFYYNFKKTNLLEIKVISIYRGHQACMIIIKTTCKAITLEQLDLLV